MCHVCEIIQNHTHIVVGLPKGTHVCFCSSGHDIAGVLAQQRQVCRLQRLGMHPCVGQEHANALFKLCHLLLVCSLMEGLWQAGRRVRDKSGTCGMQKQQRRRTVTFFLPDVTSAATSVYSSSSRKHRFSLPSSSKYLQQGCVLRHTRCAWQPRLRLTSGPAPRTPTERHHPCPWASYAPVVMVGACV